MDSRRVLILCEPGLLGHGIRSLLELDPGIEIVAVTADVTYAADIIREQQPVVLIFDSDHFRFGLGESRCAIPLQRVPTLIALSQNDNVVHVWHGEGRSLTSAEDLIEAVSS